MVKKQHYISRCVLKNFSNKKNQVFETLLKEKTIYSINIINSMCENYTYEHSSMDPNKLENSFAKIENYIGPALKEIIRKIKQFERNECTLNEIKNMFNRFMREFVIFYYRSGGLLYEFSYKRKQKENRLFPMIEKIYNSAYINSLSNTIISYYNFSIIKSDTKSFLLSDQFISTAALSIKNKFTDISNRHIGLKDTIMFIPISNEFYAIYYNGRIPEYLESSSIITLSESQLLQINKMIINNSYVKCIGFNEDSLKNSLNDYHFQYPSAIYMGFNSGATAGATLKKEIFFYKDDKDAWNFTKSIRRFDYRLTKDNDPCPCESKLVFEKCCKKHYLISKRMMDDIENQLDPRQYLVSPFATVEMSVESFFKDPDN